jgi:hypothetical protein
LLSLSNSISNIQNIENKTEQKETIHPLV